MRAKLISPGKNSYPCQSVGSHAGGCGSGLFVKPDISKHKLQEGDRIILCSDGVWSVIEDDEFAEVANKIPAEHISKALVEMALQRESDDNASVVAFQINKILRVPEMNSNVENTGWIQRLRKITR